jgi:hypothetical protein
VNGRIGDRALRAAAAKQIADRLLVLAPPFRALGLHLDGPSAHAGGVMLADQCFDDLYGLRTAVEVASLWRGLDGLVPYKWWATACGELCARAGFDDRSGPIRKMHAAAMMGVLESSMSSVVRGHEDAERSDGTLERAWVMARVAGYGRRPRWPRVKYDGK